MRKIILLLILASTSQVYGYVNKEGSTFLYAEALLWQLREGGADNWGQEIPPSGTERTITILKVPFNWSPGFRIGLGFNSTYDNWDARLYYTWYKTNKTSTAQVNSGGISSGYLGNFFANNTNGGSITASPTYSSASIRWKVLFNTIDFEIGRKFDTNRTLSLHPFIGLKAGLINQRINSNWYNPTNAVNFSTAYENLKSDFYGLGPSLGIDSIWSIYKTISDHYNIFGSVSGALMWGHWNFSDQYNNNAPLSVAVIVDKINGACSVGRFQLGIEWSHFRSSTEYSIRLGYEAQLWFDQMQYYTYNTGRMNNLMSLQGLALGFYINL